MNDFPSTAYNYFEFCRFLCLFYIQVIEDLGGAITSDGSTSTHVVTGKVRTTLNFCTALCSGLVVNLSLSPSLVLLLSLLVQKAVTLYDLIGFVVNYVNYKPL